MTMRMMRLSVLQITYLVSVWPMIHWYIQTTILLQILGRTLIAWSKMRANNRVVQLLNAVLQRMVVPTALGTTTNSIPFQDGRELEDWSSTQND